MAAAPIVSQHASNAAQPAERKSVQTLIDWLRERTERAQAQLERPSWPHRCLESFVLAEGRPYAPASLSQRETRVVHGITSKYRLHHGRFRARQCFANAQRALFLDRAEQLAYAEGYVLDERSHFPFLHGWLVLDCTVVDFTGVRSVGTLGEDDALPAILGESSGRHYLGVEFSRAYVEERVHVTGTVGSLIDDWEHGFPLLSSNGVAWRRK